MQKALEDSCYLSGDAFALKSASCKVTQPREHASELSHSCTGSTLLVMVIPQIHITNILKTLVLFIHGDGL